MPIRVKDNLQYGSLNYEIAPYIADVSLVVSIVVILCYNRKD